MLLYSYTDNFGKNLPGMEKSPLLVEARRSKRRCLSSPLFTATIVRAAKQYHGSLLTTKMATMVVFFGFVVFCGHDNLSLLVDFVTKTAAGFAQSVERRRSCLQLACVAGVRKGRGRE